MSCSQTFVTLHCLLCEKECLNETDLLEHMSSHWQLENSCPFCPFSALEVDTLQEHVITKHAEELKTPKKRKSAPAGITQNDENICTLCSNPLQFYMLDDQVQAYCGECCFYEKNGPSMHASSSNNAGVDNACTPLYGSSSFDHDFLLAKEIEKEEIRRLHNDEINKQKAEEMQFQLLQEEHNIVSNDKDDFVSQSFNNMQKFVDRHQLSTAEYFSKRFEILEMLEVGLDDQFTCTNSILPFLCKKFKEFPPRDCEWWISSHVHHYGQGFGDSGWGCGFRNLQMMISSLISLEEFKDVLHRFKDGMPSIPKLQELIEVAWSAGFDQSGKEQLNGKLVKTRKWIGTTEVFTLLGFCGLHCRVIDFHKFSDNAGKCHPSLFDWVSKYFQKRHEQARTVKTGSVHKCDLPILYLQHQGHSRSIIGVQVNIKRNVITQLLIFDPSHSKSQLSSLQTDGSLRKISSTFMQTLSSETTFGH